MRNLWNIGTTTFLAATLAVGFVGCKSEDDEGGSGGGGGGKSVGGVFGSFFGGGGGGNAASGGGNNGGGNNGGGNNGGGVPGGGDNGGGTLPGGGGDGGGGAGSVTQQACQAACTALIACAGTVCGVEIPEDAMQEGLAECVPGCTANATPQDLQNVTQAAANECAGLREAYESEGVCDEIGGGFGGGEGNGEGGEGHGEGGEGHGEGEVPVPPGGGGSCDIELVCQVMGCIFYECEGNEECAASCLAPCQDPENHAACMCLNDEATLQECGFSADGGGEGF